MKPLLSGRTLKSTILYSVDKSEYVPALLKIFPKENLGFEYGGTASAQQLYKLTPEIMELLLGPSYKRILSSNSVS